MKTITEQWTEYHERVYPDGMGREQEDQLKQCFFAGFLSGSRDQFDMVADRIEEVARVVKTEIIEPK